MNHHSTGGVLLVTGASGIAAAGARRHAAAGGRVFVISKTQETCAGLAAEIAAAGGTCDWATADLRDEAATIAAVGRAAATWGRIDGLFAVAGGSGRRFGDGPLDEIPLEGWDATLALNLLPPFLALRETLRAMLGQEPDATGSRGAIVVVSSVLAAHPSPRRFATHAYAAAKAAEHGMVIAAAAHYALRGIRINAVAPGLTDTPMAARAAADPDIIAYAAEKQPLVRGFVSPEAVAAAGLFLLSPDAAAITGQVLAVDGGWSVSEGPA
jgi:NAD(P)-dependent dehydrogenase (short-subunit alcohol dehydrogenase family)